MYAIAYSKEWYLYITYEVYKTDLFIKWISKLPAPLQTQIQMRLDRIIGTGHFGTYNFFDEIIELKWKSGLRVYTARIDKNKIAVLNGGTKNDQQKDIKKAKKILKAIKEN